MPPGKLISTERAIYIFKKTKSKYRDVEIDKIDISFIPLETLLGFIAPNNDDPELLDGYNLTSIEIEKLNELIEYKIEPDFEKFEYIFETYGIYEK